MKIQQYLVGDFVYIEEGILSDKNYNCPLVILGNESYEQVLENNGTYWRIGGHHFYILKSVNKNIAIIKNIKGKFIHLNLKYIGKINKMNWEEQVIYDYYHKKCLICKNKLSFSENQLICTRYTHSFYTEYSNNIFTNYISKYVMINRKNDKIICLTLDVEKDSVIGEVGPHKILNISLDNTTITKSFIEHTLQRVENLILYL